MHPRNSVDFETFEKDIQNIRRLKGGRSVESLSQLNADAPQILEDVSQLDDPLDYYVKHILWTQDHPNAKGANLTALLEQVTREFKDDFRYKNDVRYLKCWLMYAECVQVPKDIFVYLECNDIAKNLALFYEEYANLWESYGKIKKAESVYQLGISRNAQPIERLKRNFLAAKRRWEETELVENNEDTNIITTGRELLKDIYSGENSSSENQNIAKPINSQHAKLKVFYDPNGSLNEPKPMEWNDIGTIKSRNKENSLVSGPWTGVKLQQDKITVKSIPKLKVFKDPDIKETMEQLRVSSNKPLKPISSTQKSLSQEPLQNFSKSSSQSDHSMKNMFKMTAGSSKPHVAAGPSKPVMKAQDQCGYIFNQIYPGADRQLFDTKYAAHCEEYCFEELRINEYRKKLTEENVEIIQSPAADASNKPLSPEIDLPVNDKEYECVENNPELKHIQKCEPTMTINTRAALADIMGMFHDPLNTEECQEDESSDSSFEGIEKTCTVIQQLPVQKLQFAKLTVWKDDDLDKPEVVSKQNKPAGSVVSSKFNDRIPLSQKPKAFTKEEKKKLIELQNERPPISPIEEPISPLVNKNTSSNRVVKSKKSISRKLSFGDALKNDRKALGLDGFLDDEDDHEELFSNPLSADGKKEFSTDSIIIVETNSPDSIKQAGKAILPNGDIGSDDYLFKEDRQSDLLLDRRAFGGHILTPIVETSREYFSSTGTTSTARTAVSNPTTSSTILRPITEQVGIESDWEFTAHSERRNIPENTFKMKFEMPDLAIGSHEINGDRSYELQKFGFDLDRKDLEHGKEYSARDNEFQDAEELTKGFDFMTVKDSPKPSIYDSADLEKSPIHWVDSEWTADFISDYLATDANNDSALILHSTYTDCRPKSMSKYQFLERLTKNWAGKTSDTFSIVLGIDHTFRYVFRKKLGSGAFASVYKCLVPKKVAYLGGILIFSEHNQDENACEYEEYPVALKIQKSASVWEFYIMKMLHHRMRDFPFNQLSFIRALTFYHYYDEGYLTMQYTDEKSLLSMINNPKNHGTNGVIDELLSIFFGHELLRLVLSLHRCQIIHADIKPDNFLVRLGPQPEDVDLLMSKKDHDSFSVDLSYNYKSDGSEGWCFWGLRCLDFGRSVDLTLFPNDSCFVTSWKDEQSSIPNLKISRTSNTVFEERMRQPWGVELDYVGVCGVLYCLLFGKYLNSDETFISIIESPSPEIFKNEVEKWISLWNWKRYWQPFWKDLFISLFTGNLKKIMECCELMSIYLENNCEKGGKSLKLMLHKLYNNQ